MGGEAALADRLAAFVAAVAKEAVRRKAFAQRLDRALTVDDPLTLTVETPLKPHRRSPAALNPFDLFERGEDELREGLAALDVEQLKDVIAEHGMDRDKLAMKWKTPGRLVERIVETVRARAQKGDVFLRR